MRYILASFLGVLLLMVVGVGVGYLSFDPTAPGGPQLAVGSLAYEWGPYGWSASGGEDDDIEIYDVWSDVPADAVVYYPDGSWSQQPSSPVLDEPVYYDPWDDWAYTRYADPYWDQPYYGYGEYYYEPVTTVQNPWYVNSFPGIGSMFQQIIPGQANQTIVVQAPSAPPPRVIYPQSSCWISSQPSSVAYGGSAQIQWSSFNASHASLTDLGTVPLSGSRTITNVTTDRTYQLNVSGQGGSGSCYTRISVQGSSTSPSCVIAANPDIITVGQTASLAWGSLNAASAHLSGVGAVSTSGGQYVAPRQTTTFILTVYNSQGIPATCMAQVGVLP
ncbi:hypothetical protein A2853_00285 [Candidatus Kaiserbacteria bacterium RIFCSPHIGHO2_01_FULL_55_17]|uniref:Uncharacterized protein n=1 Tax=Candidatus Kaiserbacteria bacterium RIFCSPHIGHO2_01_FULL_55_17 TaxID=1798484 RepID=A0A1F6DA80_9BACT|nr:MAG: hypothetical protein A2853_00285 [Candidatus Kaiserbacteria bacterium RIFCSPHIGHO2_01_FULL_55_17]